MFYIIVGSITFVALILLIIAIYYNKLQFSIVKIEEAEANIEIYLNKKLELIKRCIPIIKKGLKKKEFLNEVDEVNIEVLNHFELNNTLTDISKKLFKTIDDNDKLYKSEALINVITEYNENEVELIGTIKFYNDTVVDYNYLMITFPSNIIRRLFGYKKKEFYSHEKREIFEILKEEKEVKNQENSKKKNRR